MTTLKAPTAEDILALNPERTKEWAEQAAMFAKETAEALNALGGLEAANATARPWADVRKELGIDG